VETLLDKAWLLPAIMAGSFLVILLIGKRLPERVRALIGIGAVGTCFVLSIGIGIGWIDRVDNPPEGEEAIAAAEACGLTPEQAVATVEGGHGEAEEPGAEETGDEEEATADEQAAGASGFVAAAEEGEEHHSVLPVCTQWTWFESGSFPGASLVGVDGGEDEGDHGGGAAGESAAVATGAAEEPVAAVVEAEESGGGFTVQWGTLVDGLSAMMLFTVCAISLLVHIYSTEYLHNDVRHTHYYAFLSLFTASMLFYVLGTSTIQMLVGWELVGLCSFGLIGHWWEEKKNSDAALKAFLTNRVGDMGLIVGVVLIFFAAGQTFSVFQINDYALSDGANQTLLLIGALCLFGGVTSKSGQFPLHTWLPDAMAGPTPVSALIHAATMVVAGVYLIARLYPVFFEGLNIATGQINYVAFIGGFTVVMAACLAFVQTDLKKVLAYSTVSQLGYMVMALGVGAWTAGVFHLFTHAFFKAGLFLGAGSVSHACHHSFDMREMGGLRKQMPVTFWTWIVGTMALMGIFPLAGFWSKDEVLAGAQQGQDKAYVAMLVMGIIGAMLTAAYMTRATWLTFFGEYRGHAHPHESPKVITVPLILLSFGAAAFGFLNLPKWFNAPEGFTTRFEHYVEPTFLFPEVEHPSFSLPLALISTGLALFGFFLAYQYFAMGRSPFKNLTQKAAPAKAGYRFLENKYYLDTLYEEGVRDTVKGPVARASYWFNQNVIDRIVNAVGVGARLVGNFLYRSVDQKIVDGAVNGTGTGASESGQVLRRIQTGNVQWYAALLFMGVVLFGVVSILVVTV
jgi:NADH-quinone oxidoreductase subunit L